MASQFFPALDVRTQQPENPLDLLVRFSQLKAMQNQQALQGAQLEGEQLRNRQTSLALQDDEAWRAALSDPNWDGSPEQLLKNGLKHGAGAKSYVGMQQGLTQLQENAAKVGSEQLGLYQTLSNKIGDLWETVRDAKPEERLEAQQAAKQEAINLISSTPGLNAQHRAMMLQHVNAVPDDQPIPDDQISLNIGLNKLNTNILDEAVKRSQASEATAKAGQAQQETKNLLATLPKLQAESAAAPTMAQLGITQRRAEISKTQAETAKARAETENLGQLPVFAVDPKTSERVMTTRPEAAARGYTNIVPVKEGDVNKERDATAMTNDVQLNTSRYRTAVEQMHREPMTGKQALALTALAPEKLGIDLGAFKLNVPDLIQKVTNAQSFSVLSDTQKRAVVGYYSTLASVPAAQKALTGIGRSNKEMLDLELRTIPTPLVDGGTFNIMLDRFQGNIDQTARKNVRIPGMPTAQDVRRQNEPGWSPQGQESSQPSFQIPRPFAPPPASSPVAITKDQHLAGQKATGLPNGHEGTGSDGRRYMVKGGVWVPKQPEAPPQVPRQEVR